MELQKELLEHPFYQAWNDGEVTEEQLAKYAAAYQTFMERVPTYWKRVLEGLDVDDEQGGAILEDESEHAELWSKWRRHLEQVDDAPVLSELFSGLDEMSPSELAGALHAYEVQQPEVAETKRDGLQEHYGFEAGDDLEFFEEHAENEDDHISFGQTIRENYADTEAFDQGFARGSALVYHSLDAFTAAC